VRFNVGRFGCFNVTRVLIETALRVALVAKPTTRALVLCKEAGMIRLVWMDLSASNTRKRALAGQERQTNFFRLSALLMSIDAIRPSTTCSIFTHSHGRRALGASLKGDTLVIVNIVLSARHGRHGEVWFR
jgi:hypothetical protein